MQIVDSYADQSASDIPIPNLDEINKHFTGKGSVQDLYKNLQSANTEFSGSCIKKLGFMCPLSVGVVHEQI